MLVQAPVFSGGRNVSKEVCAWKCRGGVDHLDDGNIERKGIRRRSEGEPRVPPAIYEHWSSGLVSRLVSPDFGKIWH